MRAIRSIGKDEEICVSYVDIGESTSERGSELKKNYLFACTCERCKAECNSDCFKRGLLCPKCKEGYFTSLDKVCSKCKSEISYGESKSINKEIDKLHSIISELDTLVHDHITLEKQGRLP